MKKVILSLLIAILAVSTLNAGVRDEVCPSLKLGMTIPEVSELLKGYTKVTEDEYLGMKIVSFVNWKTYDTKALSFYDGKLAQIYISSDKEKNRLVEKRLIEEYGLKPENVWVKSVFLDNKYVGIERAKFYICTKASEAWKICEGPTGCHIKIMNGNGLTKEWSQYTLL